MSSTVLDDPFCGFGVEVRLKSEDDFLKIKETLTRIGVCNRKKKILYQSCHILHKRGRYSIIHFKELYALDAVLDKGNRRNFFNDVSQEDIARRNKIVKILAEWNLLEEVDPAKSDDPLSNMDNIKVLRFNEVPDWELVPKYVIGKYKNKQ